MAVKVRVDYKPNLFITVRIRMKKLYQQVLNFVRNEDGPTAVEYAVMLALIIVLCIVVIRQVGTSSSATFSKAASAIS